MNQFHHNWLTNAAAVSLIIFSLIGSISMVMPYIERGPAQNGVRSSEMKELISPRQSTMSHTFHETPERDAMTLKKGPKDNAFTSVKRVMA